MANKSINKHNVAAINRSGKVTVSLNVALAAVSKRPSPPPQRTKKIATA